MANYRSWLKHKGIIWRVFPFEAHPVMIPHSHPLFPNLNAIMMSLEPSSVTLYHCNCIILTFSPFSLNSKGSSRERADRSAALQLHQSCRQLWAHASAQADPGASVCCVLYCIWSHRASNLHSKKQHIFLITGNCIIYGMITHLTVDKDFNYWENLKCMTRILVFCAYFPRFLLLRAQMIV